MSFDFRDYARKIEQEKLAQENGFDENLYKEAEAEVLLEEIVKQAAEAGYMQCYQDLVGTPEMNKEAAEREYLLNLLSGRLGY